MISKPHHWILISLAILVFAIISAAAAALIYLNSSHARKWALSQINAHIPGILSVTSHRLSLVDSRSIFEGVTVQGPDGEKLLTVERIDIDWRWLPLVRSEIRLDRILVQRPEVNLRVSRKGRLNLQDAFELPPGTDPAQAESTPRPHLTVSQLIISEGSVRFADPARNTNLQVNQIDLKARADLQQETGHLTLDAAQAMLRKDNRNLRLGPLHITTGVAADRLEPLVIKAHSGDSKIDLTGWIDALKTAPEANLKVELHADLAQAQDLLQIDPPPKGIVSAAIDLTGRLDAPAGGLQLTVTDGRFFDQKIGRLSADLKITDRVLTIASIEAKTEYGRTRLKGEIDFRPAFSRGWQAGPIDLNRIAYRFDVEHNDYDWVLTDDPKTVTGRLTASMRLIGKGIDADSLSAASSLKIHGQLTSADTDVPPLPLSARAEAKLQGAHLSIEAFEGRLDQAHFSGGGTTNLTGDGFEASLAAQIPELAAVLAPFDLPSARGNLTLEATAKGRYVQPQVAVRMTGRDLALDTVTLGNIDLTADIEPSGRVVIADLALANRGSRAAARGQIDLFQTGFVVDPAAALDLVLELKNVEASDFTTRPGVSGSMTGSLRIGGDIRSIAAQTALEARNLAVPQLHLGDARLDARLQNGRLDIGQLAIESPGSRLWLSGQAQVLVPGSHQVLRNPTFEADITGDAVRLERFYPDFKGQIDLTARLEGSIDNPKAAFELSAMDLDLAGQSIARLVASGRFDTDRLWIDDLTAVAAESEQLHVEGWVARDGRYDAKLSGAGISLQRLAALSQQPGLTGRLAFEASGTGSFSAPELKGWAHLQQPGLDDLDLPDLDLRFDLANQHLLVRGSHETIAFDADYGLETKRIAADLNLNGIQLAPYLKAAGRPGLSGRLSARISTQGELDNLEQLTAEGDITSLQLALEDRPLLRTRNARLALRNRLIMVERFDATLLEQGHITLSGSGPIGAGPLALTVAGNVPLAAVEPFLNRKDQMDGQVALDARITGTIAQPVVDGQAEIRQVRLQLPELGQALDQIDGQIRFTPAALVVERLTGRIGAAGRLDLEGRLALDSYRPGPISARLDLKDIELAPYLKTAGRPELSGRLSARVSARGELDNLEQLTAEGDNVSLQLALGDRPLLKTRNARLALRNRTLTIERFEASLLEQGKLKLSGSGPIGAGPLALTVAGDIPLAAVEPFLKRKDQMDGNVLIDARITGSVAQPVVDGQAEIRQVRLQVPGMDQPLDQINGQIRFTPTALVVERLTGRIGEEGRVLVEGRLSHDSYRPGPMDMRLTAAQVPVSIPDTLDARLNADLILSGTTDKSLLSGEVILVEGVYTKDVDLKLINRVGQKTRAQAPLNTSAKPSALNKIALDVALRYRQPLVVDNNLAQLAIRPDLNISGSLARPVVSGRADVPEGTVVYNRKTFEVTRGIVDFVNPYRIEPSFDIAAETQIRKWLVSLAISGTPDALVFALTSEPPESHEDLLSLLLLGKTSKELIAGEGGKTVSTQKMLTALVADTIGEDVKKTTGLDILELETETVENEDTDTVAEAVRITVGKKLSRRLTVKYAVESVEGETVQRATSEYQVLDHLLLSGFQDSHGIFGGDLLFRLEFR